MLQIFVLAAHMASGPRSPVRMRIASSIARDENLAVADAARVRAACMIASTARSSSASSHDDLDLHLGQEIDDVFGAAIKLGVALLAAEALRFDHGDAFDADLVQCFLHLIQLEGLDDRFDLFHELHTTGV